MRILLVHPEDDPESGPWSSLAWDRIVDIGLGGVSTYARWTKRFHCPVSPLGFLRDRQCDLRRVREVLGFGCGHLIDEQGLDWWEMTATQVHGEIERFLLMQQFVQSLGSADEIYISRPGIHASLLESLLGRRAHVYAVRRGAGKGGLGHYARITKRLSASQMIDIFWDKYDAGYQIRGRFAWETWGRTRQSANRPAVLLPTAYVNVSRTAMAYANTFPEENFLLVATRRSGWVQHPPPNVATAWLSSYASLRDRSRELAEMESGWRSLLRRLKSVPEYGILNCLGRLDFFMHWIRHGFEVRDAWVNVFEREQLQGVLCADDSNPYTRLPVLLAQKCGLPNIACHHGALDGRYFFKRACADVIWARGKMEQDYLVRCCGVPLAQVEIGAPEFPQSWNDAVRSTGRAFRPYLLFLSEATDQSGGRSEEFYRDTLPQLADMALATGRTLIVKLHPAESKKERSGMIARILSSRQKSATRLLSGPLTEDLLSKAWFGITILSTVAMECAVRGIPCFLCTWLECWPYGYVNQFIRYEVGIGLNHADEISKIPEYLKSYSVRPEVRENCWHPVAAERLQEILNVREKYATAAS
jgi:hypothetical protein